MENDNKKSTLLRRCKIGNAYCAIMEFLMAMEICDGDGRLVITPRKKAPLFASTLAIADNTELFFEYSYSPMQVLDMICKELGIATPPKINQKSYDFKGLQAVAERLLKIEAAKYHLQGR